MAGKKFFGFILLILASSTFAFLFYNRFSARHSFEYGDKIGRLEFKDAGNEKLRLNKGRWCLILVSKNLDRDYSLIKYINTLWSNKFRELQLDVVLLTDSTRSTEIFGKNKILFPILQFDDNLDFLSKLPEPVRYPTIFLIAPSLKIEFVSNFIKEDDVRQILEKCILGRIGYSDSIKEGKLAIGDIFPPITVIDLVSGEEKVIKNDPGLFSHVWIIFTSKCISCSLKSYLLSYSIMEDELKEKSNLSIGLIFSQYFNKKDVVFRLGELKIKTKAFLAGSELFNIEDTYYKNMNTTDDVVVIMTDHDDQITYIESFSTFISDFKGGEIF
jgi:hypothetical protein